MSIAERGNALSSGQPLLARKAQSVTLTDGATITETFCKIARSCIGQILTNHECLSTTGAPEAIHQMRVGLRRLRSAISVFRPLIASPHTDNVTNELRWLQGCLGPARDADVFIAEILQPSRHLFADDREFQTFAALFHAKRHTARGIAQATMADPRFTRLLLRLRLWADGEGWLEAVRQFGPADPEQPARTFAQTILEKRYRRLCRGMQNLAALDDEKRHLARINAKKFRYSTEFFASLFDKKKVLRMVELVSTLQDSLGALNDIAVSRTTLFSEAVQSGDPAALWAAGLIAGWHAARRPELLARAEKNWTACRRLHRFWAE